MLAANCRAASAVAASKPGSSLLSNCCANTFAISAFTGPAAADATAGGSCLASWLSTIGPSVVFTRSRSHVRTASCGFATGRCSPACQSPPRVREPGPWTPGSLPTPAHLDWPRHHVCHDAPRALRVECTLHCAGEGGVDLLRHHLLHHLLRLLRAEEGGGVASVRDRALNATASGGALAGQWRPRDVVTGATGQNTHPLQCGAALRLHGLVRSLVVAGLDLAGRSKGAAQGD